MVSKYFSKVPLFFVIILVIQALIAPLSSAGEGVGSTEQVSDLSKYSKKWYYSNIISATKIGLLDSFGTNADNLDSDITIIEFIKLCLSFSKITVAKDSSTSQCIDLAKKVDLISPDDRYKYNDKITRQAASKLLCKTLKLKPGKNKNAYSDTRDKYVQRLYDENILKTYPVMKKYFFKPNKTLTKAEALTLMVNAYNYKKSPNSLKALSDGKGILRLPILTYHSLSDDPKSWSDYIISPKKFRDDMVLVKSLGYTTVDIPELVAYTEGYLRKLPDKPILITFDDGYKDNYDYAFKTALELNTKFTLFVIGNTVNFPGSKGNSKFLSVNEMVEMYNSGLVEIQNHTFNMHTARVSHGLDSGMRKAEKEKVEDYTKRIVYDISLNEQAIEKYIGCKVNSVSYPFGIHNSLSEKAIREKGYDATFISGRGVNNLNEGLYQLKRINMSNNLDRSKLKDLLK